MCFFLHNRSQTSVSSVTPSIAMTHTATETATVLKMWSTSRTAMETTLGGSLLMVCAWMYSIYCILKLYELYVYVCVGFFFLFRWDFNTMNLIIKCYDLRDMVRYTVY